MISIPTSRELFFRGGASKVITRRRQNADGIAAKHFFLARVRVRPWAKNSFPTLEGMVIPHFEYMMRLKAEGKILASGIPVGDRAFVCIIEAASNDEADRIVRDMPAWGLLEWKVTPLQSVEARAEMERKVVQQLKSTQR